MARRKVDPTTISTIWHFMQRVCREMRETMERTATSIQATTLHDLAYGIWDAQAQAIAIPEGFPCRLISSSFPIRAVLKKFGGKIFPGDVFITNHPFLAGAVHLPDWVFIRPIFYKKELTFFTCMGTHVPDNGGAQPGVYFLAVDSIAEGLNIPPIKLVEKGQVRDDILDLILANNRLADMMRREVSSLIGSTAVAERRLLELLDRYGKRTVFASIEEMMDRTEKAVRAEISRWPNGTYYAEAKTDDDGANIGVPVTARCKLTIQDGEITFDFTGSDDQCKGYCNAGYSVTLSNAVCTSFLFLDPALAAFHNEGSLRPIHVIAPEGTFLNCKPGSLVAAAPSLGGAMVWQCVIETLSQALPHRAIAPYGRAMIPVIVGNDPRNGRLYAYVTFCPDAGAGAIYGYDGYQCCCTGDTLGVVSKSDAEEEMVRFPWRIKRYEFMSDAHGAGKWRSAPGIAWEGVNEGSDCRLSLGACDGWFTQGQGRQGGEATRFNKAYIQRADEQIEIKQPHLMHNIKMGEILVTRSGGGAGVGRPEERDPEAVRMDIKNELVSINMARDIYKVVLNPDTLEIDYKATQEMRNKIL
jgi:N-methylhydantoinase B